MLLLEKYNTIHSVFQTKKNIIQLIDKVQGSTTKKLMQQIINNWSNGLNHSSLKFGY